MSEELSSGSRSHKFPSSVTVGTPRPLSTVFYFFREMSFQYLEIDLYADGILGR